MSDPGLASNRSANSLWNMRIAHRNCGRCDSNLKTSGEEIYNQGNLSLAILSLPALPPPPLFLFVHICTHLIWCIADDDVKVAQWSLAKVSNDYFQFLLLHLSLHSFAQFGCHSWIHFNHLKLFALFQDANCQITCSRSYLKDYISRLQCSLVNNAIIKEQLTSQQLHFLYCCLRHQN